jgi:collagen type III alpha
VGLFNSKAGSPDEGLAGGVRFDVWGQRGWHNVDVVGESHYTRDIRALFPAQFGSTGRELTVPVSVTHDARNRHDPNAVQVCASTGLLGYLSRADASRYAPVLSALQAQGMTPMTTAKVWGSYGYYDDGGKNDFVGSVSVDLPEPHMMVPANLPPAGAHSVLPVGSAIQVTGEEKFMPAIVPFLNPRGECWVYATLHELVDQTSRTAKVVAETRIDGQPVGRLSPKMSGDMLPVVTYLQERGALAAVRAIVKGNPLKAEVVLQTMRSSELPADWFDHSVSPGAAGPNGADGPSMTGGAGATVPGPAAPANGTLIGVPPPSLPPADWYPDPHGLARLRYWDGDAWTEHTAP